MQDDGCMNYLFSRCRLWILAVCLLGAGGAHALEAVRIGVLAFQSKPDTLLQWTRTAQSLSQSLPDFRFEFVPLNYEELNLAAKEKRVDFVLTNPEHYVVMRNVFFLRPMVTLNTLVEGQVFNQFGSVIFTRRDLPEIQTLSDVRGKKVAAVGLYSLGGFLIAADAFRLQHVDLRSNDVSALKFVGLPHTGVVEDVIHGHSDVGIVRTGVLEQMVRQGKLQLAQVRVLNAKSDGAFPLALSTDTYPEWPWAALPHTGDTLVKAVTLALLNIRPESEEARAGRYHSFSPPANYTPVEVLMRRLKVYPGVEVTPLWEELWEEYQSGIRAFAIGMALLVLAFAVYLWRKNRRLKRLTELYRDAQTGLQITSAAFASQVALIVTDAQTRIVRANDAFCSTMGYAEADLTGRTTSDLRGDSVAPGTGRSVWSQLLAKGQWQGDLAIRRKDGHELPCRVTITSVQNDLSQRTGFVGTFVDMSEQIKTESEIRALAYYDTLTGLPNRRLFLEKLQTAMASSLQSGQLGAVLFIDLDHFKLLNDSHGHTIGDELLQAIARRLEHVGSERAMAARLGGDEFVVMLHALSTDPVAAMQSAMATARTLREAILAPYQLNANPGISNDSGILRYSCSGSIGVALFGLQEEPLVEVLKRADVAMYQAKQSGRNTIRSFDPAGQEWLKANLALSNDLRSALSDGQLVLHYQLQIFADGRVAGAECLLRWQHPQRGMVSPAEFIGLAEESGAIVPIGEWVLQTACDTLARWERDEATQALTLSVNVSPRQFIEADFAPRLETLLLQSGARAERLVLEITEGIALENTDQVIKKMLGLRRLGIQFSIDDFGTGYSSLSYLHALPLHEVKIDRAFVNDLTENAGSEAIVRAIIALGSSLQLQVVSEGVETQAQKDKLVAMGCTLLQGYWVARPMELAAFEHLLEERRSR
jgi:diguanylate cyclase (GGDEF)-like protein/PAS domain S-box-containing protein